MSWDLEILVDLAAREQVETIAPAFDGILTHYRRAVEELSAVDVKIRHLKGSAIHVTFRDEGGAAILDDMPAELRFVKLRLNTDVRVQVAKLQLKGVEPEMSNDIVGMLESRVRVEVAHDQQVIQAVAGQHDRPAVGMVVTGNHEGNTVCGEMTGENDGRIVVDDFGVVYTLDAVSDGFWVESTDDLVKDDHLGAYAKAVEAMDERPSWSVLVEAMGQAWSDGLVQRPSGSTAYLNAAVVQRAEALQAGASEASA